MSASKAWNLAGLKAGLLIAGEEATAELAGLAPETSHGPSHAGVVAQTAAYAESHEWLDAAIAGLEANRTLLVDLLAESAPQVKISSPSPPTWRGWTSPPTGLMMSPMVGLKPQSWAQQSTCCPRGSSP